MELLKSSYSADVQFENMPDPRHESSDPQNQWMRILQTFLLRPFRIIFALSESSLKGRSTIEMCDSNGPKSCLHSG